MPKTYFFKLLPGDFTDLHQTWHTASVDLLTNCQKNFNRPNNTQVITSCRFGSKQEVLHISTFVWSNNMKLGLLLPHELLRPCAKAYVMTTWWRSLNSSILYLHICSSDWHEIWYNYCQCHPEGNWWRVYRSATRWRSGGRLIWYLALCPHHNTYGNEIHRSPIEWPLWLTHQKWPAGGYFQCKSVFGP